MIKILLANVFLAFFSFKLKTRNPSNYALCLIDGVIEILFCFYSRLSMGLSNQPSCCVLLVFMPCNVLAVIVAFFTHKHIFCISPVIKMQLEFNMLNCLLLEIFSDATLSHRDLEGILFA